MTGQLPQQYPAVGARLVIDLTDDEAELVSEMEFTMTRQLGAARLYEARTPDGGVGVVAVQPDGSCWIVRDFEDPDEDAWRER